jgi:uncharacterized protein YndB with AHSA1/START domain
MSPPVVVAHMLVRAPVARVFQAFVDPAITTHFWFSKSIGALEAGKQVRFEWEMYGASAEVDVKEVVPNQRIVIDWGNRGQTTRVEWTFEARGDATYVTVKNSGFAGDADAQLAAALDSKGGFTLLLAGAKTFLEHGIEPRFVIDHHPDAVVEAWRGR